MQHEIQHDFQIAARFAAEKHLDQKVKNKNGNFLLHLSYVAMEVIFAHQNDPTFDLNLAVKIAWLHDTLEKTDTSYDELLAHFGKRVSDAVVALSKDERITDKQAQMIETLERIKMDSVEAKVVKLADRTSNLQPPPKGWDKDQIQEYYTISLLIYNELKGTHHYLEKRFLSELNAYKNKYIS